MTDRRREAIDEIYTALVLENDYGCHHIMTAKSPQERAEELYNRLATLREFPEEAESMLTELFEIAKAPWVNSAWLRTWGQKFKRLWRGQEPRGGCSECGGSGKRLERPHASTCPKANRSGPCFCGADCPDCKGTGERRKGERRKDAGKRDYDRANHTNDIDGCAPQYETLKGKTLDRRISEERRKTREMCPDQLRR